MTDNDIIPHKRRSRSKAERRKVMREILFRGKNIQGEWKYGYYVEQYGAEQIYLPDGVDREFGFDCYHVIPETIGQYTELTDKNGKKIFEGDIVKFGKYIYQIVFLVGSFALYDEQGLMIAKIGGVNDCCYSLMDLYVKCCWEEMWAYDIEVIGNIHDNPELLKGE